MWQRKGSRVVKCQVTVGGKFCRVGVCLLNPKILSKLGSQGRKRWEGIQSIHMDIYARSSGRMCSSCSADCFFLASIVAFMGSHISRHISQKSQQLGVNQSHCSALILCSAVSVSTNIQIMKFSFITFLAMFAVQNYGTWIRACVYEKRQGWLIFM